jgi:response regulator RpfG family c-di-GMP phosphodiesterase
MTIEETMGIIKDGSGTHFDPAVVSAFEKGMDGVMEIYDQYKEL